MIIRDETPADRPHVDLLLDRAFGGTYESRLVARLRAAALVAIALVAEEEANFMALELVPGSLSGIAGAVTYPPVFSQ